MARLLVYFHSLCITMSNFSAFHKNKTNGYEERLSLEGSLLQSK